MKNHETINVHHQAMIREMRDRNAQRASNGLWFALLLVMGLSAVVGAGAVVLWLVYG